MKHEENYHNYAAVSKDVAASVSSSTLLFRQCRSKRFIRPSRLCLKSQKPMLNRVSTTSR